MKHISPLLMLLLTVSTSHAQTFATWNVNSSGNWSTGGNWTGGIAPNGIGHSATFGINSITADRTATLDVSVTLGTLTFSGDTAFSYSLAGANTLTFNSASANPAITVNVGSPIGSQVFRISAPINLAKALDINVNSALPPNPVLGDNSLEISSNITGSFGINKLRPGLLVLQGTNSFTGPSTLALGELRLDRSINNTDKFSSSTLALSSQSTLSLIGNSAGSVQSVTTSWGNGHLLFRSTDADAGDANVTTLSMFVSGLTSSTGTYYFQSVAQTGTADFTQGRIRITNSNPNNNGILVGRSLAGTGANPRYNDFASVDASGFIQAGPVGGYTSQSDVSLWGAFQNISTDAPFTNSVGTLSINSLRINAGSAGNTLTINTGNTLKIFSGGLLLTDNIGANPTLITGGALTGDAVPLVIFHNNGSFGQESAKLTIASQIAGSILLKEGPGTLELTNAGNTQISTIIRSGTLRLFSSVPASGNSVIGVGTFLLGDTGTNTADSPHLILASSLTFSRVIDATQAPQYSGSATSSRYRISVEGGNTATLAGDVQYFQAATSFIAQRALELSAASDTDRLIVDGRILGFGASQQRVYINGRGSGTGTVRFNNANNAFPGTIVSDGVLEIGASGSNIVGSSSVLQVGDADTSSSTTRLGVLLGSSVLLNKFTSLSPNAANLTPDLVTFGSNETGASQFNSLIGISPALENWNLRLQAGLSATRVNFVSTINNPGTFNGPGGPFNAIVSIEKTGPGTVVLFGANTYQGNTTINQGRLLVNNSSGSGTGSGNVIVNNGTLGGTGTISGSVTVNAATIQPGSDNPGTLQVGGTLQLASTSTTYFQLGGTTPGNGAAFYSQLHITGTATLDGTLTLDPGLFNPIGNVFYLLDRGTGAGDGSTFAGLSEGGVIVFGGGMYQGNITYLANWTGTQAGSSLTGGNDVALFNVTAVPEPITITLLTTAAGLFLGRRYYVTRQRYQQHEAEVDPEPGLD